MWYSTQQINKVIPAFVSDKPTRVDFFNVRKYNSYTLPSTATYINYYLFKLTFSNSSLDPLNTLSISPTITNIYDYPISNNTYKPTSIDILSPSKSYIIPFKGIDSADLNPIYILTDVQNTVTLDLELDINDISNYSDIYNFLNTNYTIKNISFQDNHYSNGLAVTKDFLSQIPYSFDNVVTITYSINVDLNILKSKFFNYTLNIIPYNLNIFNITDTNYLFNYSDLELIDYKSDNYFKLYSIEDMTHKTAIINSDRLITII